MIIEVIVKTRSSKTEIIKKNDNLYEVRLKSIPVLGKANLELIDTLKDYFDVPKSKIFIKSGSKSKLKLIEIIK